MAMFDRLTSLPEVLAQLKGLCSPVSPVLVPIEQAYGRIAGDALFARLTAPREASALRAGWAVTAQDTQGASPYTPCLAGQAPRLMALGEPLPEGMDAILPAHAVRVAGSFAEILAAAAPGDFVRGVGGDLAEGDLIVAAGEKLRADHVSILALARQDRVPLRIPRIAVLTRDDKGTNHAAARFLVAAAGAEGANANLEAADTGDPERLASALLRQEADLVLVLGGCGPGGVLAQALSRAGKILTHGLAVHPGEELGCGSLAGYGDRARVVVLVPDRMEMAFAAWLLLVRPCLRLLAGAGIRECGETFPLTRKIVSNPGWTDLVLLRRVEGTDAAALWEPLATGDLPWRAIARADAWMLVPPESEGYAAGQPVFGQIL